MDNLSATAPEMFALELEGWAGSVGMCEHFPLIPAPTLIICGEKENADGSAELAARALPAGTAVVLEGLGHLRVFWRSDLAIPLIRDFLDQHHPRARPLTGPLQRQAAPAERSDAS